MKLSASLFFCFSAISTLHGAQGPQKRIRVKKEETSAQQSSTHLSYPWTERDGVLVYDSEPGRYDYAEKTDRKQFVKVSLTTSPVSKR